jgi:hypothetical protein
LKISLIGVYISLIVWGLIAQEWIKLSPSETNWKCETGESIAITIEGEQLIFTIDGVKTMLLNEKYNADKGWYYLNSECSLAFVSLCEGYMYVESTKNGKKPLMEKIFALINSKCQ